MPSKAAVYARHVLAVLTLLVSFAWVRGVWWSTDALIIKDVASNGTDLVIGSGSGVMGICLAFFHDDYRGKVWYESNEPREQEWLPLVRWWYPNTGGIGFEIAVPDWLLIIVFGSWPAWHMFRSYQRRTRDRRLLQLCEECGYDLRGTIAAARSECPECGSKFDL